MIFWMYTKILEIKIQYDMIDNKKLSSITTDLFIRGRKLNTSIVFNTQYYFKVPKDVRYKSSDLI